MEKHLNGQEQEVFPRQIADDEIDLVQLFQILLKRKYLIIGVVIFCLSVGGAYVLLKQDSYEYTTTLQIGTSLVEDDNTFKKLEIEGTSSVKLKLEKVYIPDANRQLSTKHNGRLVSVDAKEQKNSNIIMITSKGGADDDQYVDDFHHSIIMSLIANHSETLAAAKMQYEILVERSRNILKDLENPKLFGMQETSLQRKIESAEMKLAEFEDKKKILLSQKKGLDQTKKLLTEQIASIGKNLKLSYSKRNSALTDVDDATQAMTFFLMLNSDIQQNERRSATLRERLNVTMENEEQQLEGQFAEIQRAIKLQGTKIDEAKSQLINLRAQRLSKQEQQRNAIAAAENKINLYQDTKALSIAVRSLKPVGQSKALIVALAAMLGLMAGVMLAFIAEFMIKVRQQQRG